MTPLAGPAQSSHPRRDCEKALRFVTRALLLTAAELGLGAARLLEGDRATPRTETARRPASSSALKGPSASASNRPSWPAEMIAADFIIGR